MLAVSQIVSATPGHGIRDEISEDEAILLSIVNCCKRRREVDENIFLEDCESGLRGKGNLSQCFQSCDYFVMCSYDVCHRWLKMSGWSFIPGVRNETVAGISFLAPGMKVSLDFHSSPVE